MKRPDFFILGAPKAGTTTLANWLSEHPQIFVSPLKEPQFFNWDFCHRSTRSFKEYEALFEAATVDHVAVGEASTRYLYSRTAVPAILGYVDKPRFIVMIRDPVDLAYSLHDQTVFNGNENVLDFEKAWEYMTPAYRASFPKELYVKKFSYAVEWAYSLHDQTVFDGEETERDFENAWDLQQVRIYGDQVPRFCADPQLLMYGPLCRLGEQLERLLTLVPRESVLLINLEHVRAAPLREYRRVLDFLGVSYDGRTIFPLANPAKERRFPGLWRTVQAGNRALRALGVPPVRVGVTRLLYRWDKNPRARQPLGDGMRARLRAYFADDVARIEGISGWDLSHWKE